MGPARGPTSPPPLALRSENGEEGPPAGGLRHAKPCTRRQSPVSRHHAVQENSIRGERSASSRHRARGGSRARSGCRRRGSRAAGPLSATAARLGPAVRAARRARPFAPPGRRPRRAGRDAPVQQQQLGDRWRARSRSPRSASRARIRWRAESTNSDGTAIGRSWPASESRASNSASRRSVLTRSARGRAVLPGATTSTAIPAARPARASAKPVGPAS